ncbi:MAG: hypothetical protein AAB353_07905, partial [Candidatus Hydrogenedentota bacterium]
MAAKPTNSANPSKEDIKEAWDYYQHADNLLHTRQNLFLLAQTILLTAFVTISEKTDLDGSLRPILAVMGIVVGINWFFSVERLPIRMKPLSDQYLRRSWVYKKYLNAIGGGEIGRPRDRLRDMFLPFLFTGFWSGILGWMWRECRSDFILAAL